MSSPPKITFTRFLIHLSLLLTRTRGSDRFAKRVQKLLQKYPDDSLLHMYQAKIYKRNGEHELSALEWIAASEGEGTKGKEGFYIYIALAYHKADNIPKTAEYCALFLESTAKNENPHYIEWAKEFIDYVEQYGDQGP